MKLICLLFYFIQILITNSTKLYAFDNYKYVIDKNFTLTNESILAKGVFKYLMYSKNALIKPSTFFTNQFFKNNSVNKEPKIDITDTKHFYLELDSVKISIYNSLTVKFMLKLE